MQVACPNCRHVLVVPPDKAATPGLKARCRCGTVFAVATAARGDAPAIPSVPSAGTAAPLAPRPRTAPPPAMMATAPEALTPPPVPPRPPGVPAGAPSRTAAAQPRLAPPVAPAKAAAATVAGATAAAASTAAAAPAASAAPGVRKAVPVPWRRCQNHPQVRSEHVCPTCTKGFCDPCGQKVQTAVICPACEGLCVAASAYEATQQQARQRARSMKDEIGVIAEYPLRDRLAFVMLALFTWFFGLFSGFAAIMYVLSKGVLTWYSFNAVSKVSIGNMRDVMPEFRDLSDITSALRLSVAALAISAGPLFLCAVFLPGAALLADQFSSAPTMEVVRAQDPPAEAPAEEDEAEDEAEREAPAAGPAARAGSDPDIFAAEREGPPSMLAPLTLLAIVVALGWMIVYMPVALTVAALSKSILSTINPLIGIDTIKKMGGTYWQALAIYFALLVGQGLIGFALSFIPFAGGFLRSFVDAYAALAIGCTLGLAVFKKAAVLGWD